jgi:general secretion pathway protein I
MLSMLQTYCRKKDSCASNRSGFTLLEILVAMSILTIALIAVYQLHTQTISMNHMLAFNSRAPFLAQQKMSQWMSMPVEEMGDDSGGFGDDFPGYTWWVSVEEMSLESLESGDLKSINVRVSLNDNEQNFYLVQYRFLRD